MLYVFNKVDSLTIEVRVALNLYISFFVQLAASFYSHLFATISQELEILDQMPNYVPLSSQHGWGVEDLLESIWE